MEALLQLPQKYIALRPVKIANPLQAQPPIVGFSLYPQLFVEAHPVEIGRGVVHRLQLIGKLTVLPIHFFQLLHTHGNALAALHEFVLLSGMQFDQLQDVLHCLLLGLDGAGKFSRRQHLLEEVEHLHGRPDQIRLAVLQALHLDRQHLRRLQRLLGLDRRDGHFLFRLLPQQTLIEYLIQRTSQFIVHALQRIDLADEVHLPLFVQLEHVALLLELPLELSNIPLYAFVSREVVVDPLEHYIDIVEHVQLELLLVIHKVLQVVHQLEQVVGEAYYFAEGQFYAAAGRLHKIEYFIGSMEEKSVLLHYDLQLVVGHAQLANAVQILLGQVAVADVQPLQLAQVHYQLEYGICAELVLAQAQPFQFAVVAGYWQTSLFGNLAAAQKQLFQLFEPLGNL